MEPDASCPICGRPLRDEPCDDEHVFGRAFGGRVTVRVHKSCNSSQGGGAESALHQQNTLLSMIRAARGIKAPPMRAETSDGEVYDVDIATGAAQLAHPAVAVQHDDKTIRASVRGSEKSVRRVLKDMRRKFGDVVPKYEDLPEEARRSLVGSPTDMKAVITLDLAAARTVVLNTAIEAGVVAYGLEFADSDLAKAMRAKRDETLEEAKDATVTGAALDALGESFEEMSGKYADWGLDPPQLASLAPDHNANDVVLVPYKNQTFVYVRVLGTPIVDGLVVDAPMPAKDGVGTVAPILVREARSAPVTVVDFTDALLDPVKRQAEAALERRDGDDDSVD